MSLIASASTPGACGPSPPKRDPLADQRGSVSLRRAALQRRRKEGWHFTLTGDRQTSSCCCRWRQRCSAAIAPGCGAREALLLAQAGQGGSVVAASQSTRCLASCSRGIDAHSGAHDVAEHRVHNLAQHWAQGFAQQAYRASWEAPRRSMMCADSRHPRPVKEADKRLGSSVIDWHYPCVCFRDLCELEVVSILQTVRRMGTKTT